MCNKNREIVRRGLELRRMRRLEELRLRAEAEREAVQDAAGREMRREVNFQRQWSQIENEVAQANERREKQDAERRAARRRQDHRRAENWAVYLLRNGCCATVAALMYVLDMHRVVDFRVCITVMFFCLTCLLINCVAYVNRNRKEPAHEITWEG